MRGTIWIWYYAPGEGTRKWALSLAGERKEREVVDEVRLRSVDARTTMTDAGKGVLEVEGAEVELVLVDGKRIARVMSYTNFIQDGGEVVLASETL